MTTSAKSTGERSLDLTPSWAKVAEILSAALGNGVITANTVTELRIQIRHMARVADKVRLIEEAHKKWFARSTISVDDTNRADNEFAWQVHDQLK